MILENNLNTIPLHGIGLSIIFKANAQVAVGSHSSVNRAPAAEAGGPGFNPQRRFSLLSGLLIKMR